MLQKRYEGFLKTPNLWEGNAVFQLQQFEIDTFPSKIDATIDDNLRLGKYVERLVSFQIQQHENVIVLAENIQIQDNKLTLGELDALILKDNQSIHLEIIYKFYVYDDTVGATEIDHFIGPNRKDSLLEKLTKLKNKQLPLLYNKVCKPYLEALYLNAKTIKQQVYFKAQLFLPFGKNIHLKTLNNACVYGHYVTKRDLKQLADFKFYIPTKKDWLIVPHTHVDWNNFETFKTIAESYISDKFSALFWMKAPNGEIKKMFLVWWTN
ncbi:hypothetical protein PK35_03370 [Tamlana nanhaiensis]|uniref:DUF1853 domain-containing protein n=1 Tax=Neotamlana nanhaiensis TaxID=1382798 RepID=A0A0D7W3W3_9FLAO|nr:DUF1853 family protein [Tamlana nanhaiensis]KJD33805.1 hypothetical protein PK35_03370 [Tamlana nanhaiensis]